MSIELDDAPNTLKSSVPEPPAKSRRIRRFLTKRRSWAHWQVLALVVVGMAIAGTAGSSGKIEQTKYDALKKQLDDTVASDSKAIAQARTDAEAAAAKKLGEEQAALSAKESELNGQADALKQREAAVSTAEAAKKANSFEDGVWEVGTDIQPGKYKAADASSSCYWAKLDAHDSIIDNDLPNGPTTVTIETTVAKFKTSNCGTWVKV